MPHLFRVLVPVSDIEQAQTFYETVLDMKGSRVSPERHYFDCDGVVLALYDPTLFEEHKFRPSPENIYLAVDDLAQALSRCESAGAEITVGIEDKDWGETSFYFRDPYGNELCFVDKTTVFTG